MTNDLASLFWPVTGLGGWVHNQQTRKRKLDRGEPSKGMMAERVAWLEALGFA
jgi:hypothetical protein